MINMNYSINKSKNMIHYNLGYNLEDECHVISWDKFLCLICNEEKYYKSQFNTFSDLYEFIDTNIKNITKIVLDGCEYILENGKLHNLYDYAKIVHRTDGPYPGTFRTFYIFGKIIYGENSLKSRIKSLRDFNSLDLFTLEYDPIHHMKYNRQTPINLVELRQKDIRSKKLKRIMSL